MAEVVEIELAERVAFTCYLCSEAAEEIDPISIGPNPVCDDCVEELLLPQFENALKYEINYPVRDGDTILHPRQYAKHVSKKFGEEFVERYEEREKEYKTPAAARIYCRNKILATNQLEPGELPDPNPMKRTALWNYALDNALDQGKDIVECGAMAGARVTPTNRAILHQVYSHGVELDIELPNYPGEEPVRGYIQLLPTCWACKGRVYTCCGEGAHPGEDPHVCAEKANAETEDFIPEGAVQGTDYQICPSEDCGRVIQLWDGCNFISCPCGTGFCFLCGVGGLKDADGHWGPNMPCPKFGVPARDGWRYDANETDRDGGAGEDNESDYDDADDFTSSGGDEESDDEEQQQQEEEIDW